MKIFNVNIIWWALIMFSTIVNLLVIIGIVEFGYFMVILTPICVFGISYLVGMYCKTSYDIRVFDDIALEVENFIKRKNEEDYNVVCREDIKRIANLDKDLDKREDLYLKYDKFDIYKELKNSLIELIKSQSNKIELLETNYKEYLATFGKNIQFELKDNKLSIYTELEDNKIIFCELLFSKNRKEIICNNGRFSLKNFEIDFDKNVVVNNYYNNWVLEERQVIEKTNYTVLKLFNNSMSITILEFKNLRRDFIKENLQAFETELKTIQKTISMIINTVLDKASEE